jgi:hypothetical protein
MPKTIHSLLHDAELKQNMWKEISHDPEALTDRQLTSSEALHKANYFEGKYDGFVECNRTNFSPDIIKGELIDLANKSSFWTKASNDSQLLLEKNKTREEALQLAKYFDGKYNGFLEVNRLVNRQLLSKKELLLVDDFCNIAKDNNAEKIFTIIDNPYCGITLKDGSENPCLALYEDEVGGWVVLVKKDFKVRQYQSNEIKSVSV